MLHFYKYPPDGHAEFPTAENFPHTTAANLFLIGSNYARAFQDAEKTNKEGMKPDGLRLHYTVRSR